MFPVKALGRPIPHIPSARAGPIRLLSSGSSQKGGRSGRGPRTRSGVAAGSSGDRAAEVRSRLGNIPSLKDFMHGTTVLRQYRAFLRATGSIPDDAFRTSAQDEVRRTFRQNASLTDKIAIEMEVTEGKRRLDQVRQMVGYVDPATKDDSDSWLNIDDNKDKRGRVGVTWPWNKPK